MVIHKFLQTRRGKNLILSCLLTLISFQTHKTFVHLQNTNEDIFNEIRQFSDTPLTVHTTTTLKTQKR